MAGKSVSQPVAQPPTATIAGPALRTVLAHVTVHGEGPPAPLALLIIIQLVLVQSIVIRQPLVTDAGLAVRRERVSVQVDGVVLSATNAPRIGFLQVLVINSVLHKRRVLLPALPESRVLVLDELMLVDFATRLRIIPAPMLMVNYARS